MSELPWRPCAGSAQGSVACFGETMVSFIPVGGGLDSAASAGLDVAGAESNVAMYLADHGVEARWISRLGDDAFGRRVLGRVGGCGVDVSAVEIDAERPTGLLFKDPRASAGGGTAVTYRRAGSAASAMGPEVLRLEAARSASLWHFTGITPALSASCRALAEAALRNGADGPRGNAAPGNLADRAARPAVSFDVNFRPAVWRAETGGTGSAADGAAADGPAALIRRLARAADIVFVGLDEAQALWGERAAATADDVRGLIPEPHILVVKDGAREATGYFGDGTRVVVPALPVEVVEPVGAGDAFAAGFLAALLRDGSSAQECLRSGHLTAASALRVGGDHGPLPPPEEFRARLHAPDREWSTHSDGARPAV